MKIENINSNCYLHDCIINNIEINNSKLILSAHNGIYKFDQNSGIYQLTNKCDIIIEINDLVEKESYEHISINVFRRNIRKSISFNKFYEFVKKYKFRIYLDFYSIFAQGLLIKGYCEKIEIELLITEINDIQFIFDKNIISI